MRILVIGGTGFIGPFVVRALVDKGHDVTVFHRGQTEADLPQEVRHIHCGDESGLQKRVGGVYLLPNYASDFRRIAPDVVLYMVPLGDDDSRIVVDTFKGIARRIVALSSQDVYRAYGRLLGSEPGPPDPVPLAEDAPLREKLYPYRGESPRMQDDPDRILDDYDKILAEHVIMSSADLPGTILRLPMVYGPRDDQHRLFRHLKRMDDHRRAILLEEDIACWRWSRSYVENVAAAVALAVMSERAAGRIYNVAEPRALSMLEWVRAIGDAVEWQGEVISLPKGRLPAHLTFHIDARHDLVVDTTRIRTELGYSESVPFDEALKRTIAWERANPPAMVDPKEFDYAAEDEILAELKE